MKKTIYILSLALVFHSCKNASFYTKRGDKNMTEGEYELAIQNYQSAIEKGASKNVVSFQIGEAYRLSNRLSEAGSFYKDAIDAGTQEQAAYVYYGLSLKSQGQYDQASAQLDQYAKKGTSKNWTKYAKYESKNIKKINELPFVKSDYEVQNVSNLNSNAEDYAPYVYNDQLIFTSSRGEGKLYTGNGMGFQDIYVTTLKVDSISKLDQGVINLEDTHEGTVTIHPDGSIMVFARSNDGAKKGDEQLNLFISKKGEDGKWGAPEKLNITDETAWDGCPMFSRDGNKLYFSSNRKGGRGGLDIYTAKYVDGKFAEVQPLGSNVNTFGNEMFPFEHESGDLYFSSNGQVGYGGLDLYREHPDEKGNYNTRAENLGKSINTIYDDFGMVFTNKRSGYFASNRPDGKGSDDIYSFIEEIIPFYFLDLEVKGEDGANVSFIDHASIKFVEDGKEVENNFTDENGHYKHQLNKDGMYEIKIEKDSFFTNTLTFKLDKTEIEKNQKNDDGDYIIKEYVTLKKIGAKESYDVKELGYDVKDILYDVAKWDIRADAATELDKLIKFLQENPGITIELGSHTDSRDSDDRNMVLSQQRAESAVDYIVKNGNIVRERITAKGYGESRLLNDCDDGKTCSEEEHQANRRTEIKVLGVKALNAEKFEEFKKAQEEARLEAEREKRQELMEEEYLMIEELKEEVAALEEKELKEGDKGYDYYLEKKTKLEELQEHFKELEAEDEEYQKRLKEKEILESDEYKEMQRKLEEMKKMMEDMEKNKGDK